jgi:hypothetical protein
MPSALDMILAKLPRYTQHGASYRAPCPGHGSDNPTTLKITPMGDGVPLLHCKAHDCPRETILAALGLTWAELYANGDPRQNGHRASRPRQAPRGKDREAERIVIALTVEQLMGLAYGPVPAGLELEAMAPYSALVGDAWDVFTEAPSPEAGHDAVQAWLQGLWPELQHAAPKLVQAIEAARRQRNGDSILGRVHKARDLLRETFPEPQAIVKDVLLEGLNLYVGKPKIGKSRLLLSVAVAVAQGGVALGSVDVDAGPVLYLSLEDPKRRLQTRLRSLLQDTEPSDNLDYATSWPRADEGGIDDLHTWMGEHPNARLIVIDTWQRFRPRTARQGNAYDQDYQALQPLQDFAHQHPGLCIVIIHHTNKQRDVEDIADLANGSQAMTGCVDGFAVLKRQRGSADAVLFVSHKDLEDDVEHALKNDPVTGGWTLIGAAAEYAMSEQRREVIACLQQSPGAMTPQAIAHALGRTGENAMNALYKVLYLMSTAGQILSPARGYYSVPTTIGKVGKVGKDGKVGKVGKVDVQDGNLTGGGRNGKVDGKDGSLDMPTDFGSKMDNLTILTVLTGGSEHEKSVEWGEPCAMCGQTTWWQNAGGRMICATCHPPFGKDPLMPTGSPMQAPQKRGASGGCSG